MQKGIIKANCVVFIASFCTLVIELVAGRIMAPHVGVSLYTWTSIIGVVLAGISLGAYVGGLLADRYPHTATLGWLLFLSGLGAFSISPLTNLIGGADWQTSLMVRILLITAVIFFVPSLLLGMISPVVVKLTLKNLKKTGNVVGKIYAFSTLGSILGTFATGFFLISWLGTRNILLIMGGILICCAPVFGGFFTKKKMFAFFLALFLVATVPLGALYTLAAIAPGMIALPSSPFAAIKASFTYASQPLLEQDIYFFKESNYYTITLQQEEGEAGRPLETLVLDHLVHSYTDLKNPLYLKYEYIRIYEEVMRWQEQARRSCNCLFIGGGGYTFPRFIDATYHNAVIDVAEIDPAVIQVGRKYLGVRPDSRITSINEDARWFIMQSKEEGKYDFVFGDAFNDLSVPYHLTTKEFTAQVKRLMKPDGILMTNVIDSFKEGKFLPAYVRTLEEVFGTGNVHLLLTCPDYDSAGIGTFVVAASPRKLDMKGFMQAIKKEKGKEMVSFVMPAHELQAYLRGRSPVILTDDYVPVDNLLAPIFEARFGYRRQ
jgi:spermidine synthase